MLAGMVLLGCVVSACGSPSSSDGGTTDPRDTGIHIDALVEGDAGSNIDAERPIDAEVSEDAHTIGDAHGTWDSGSIDAAGVEDASAFDADTLEDSSFVDTALDASWDAGPRCGDRIVQAPREECDDGNIDSGDACSPTCTLEDQGIGGISCTRPPVLQFAPINDAQLAAFATGNTAGTGDQIAGSCGGDGEAPDVVYTIVIDRVSDLNFQIQRSNATAIYLRGAAGRSCLDPASEVACFLSGSFTINDLPPGVYYLVIDGYPYIVEYQLTILLTPN
jgi:cysteine-rich repeat protein